MNARKEPAPGYVVWMKQSKELRERREQQLLAKGKKPPTRLWRAPPSAPSSCVTATSGWRRLRKRADNGGTELKGDWDPIIKPDKHRRCGVAREA